MIKIIRGNILKDKNAQAITNPVNCVGVMGAGLALQFKKDFPNNFDKYKKACISGDISLGRVFITIRDDDINRYIVNFPTKNHYRRFVIFFQSLT